MALTPMQAGALKPIVDRTGRESARYQFVRELLRNSIEAGATRVVFRPEWEVVGQFESQSVRLSSPTSTPSNSSDRLTPNACASATSTSRPGLRLPFSTSLT